MSNSSVILWAIRDRADDRGYMRTTTDELVARTALSRATVKRILAQLAIDGIIDVRSKGGRAGGLLIRLKTGSQTGSKPVHEPVQNEPVRNALKDSGSGPSALEPEPESSSQTGSRTGSAEEACEWFVCCVWRDEHDVEWCHGDDGLPTYIPCESKEVALYVADQHRYQPHKDRDAALPSRPCVDILRTIGGKTKVLAERIGVLDDGRPGGIDNPWARGSIET